MTTAAKSEETATAEQIAKCIELLAESPHWALCALDRDAQLTVIRKGIPEQALPLALRGFAEAVVEQLAKEKVEQVIAAVPESHKATCPCCSKEAVMLPCEDGTNILHKPGVVPRAVCMCGAFLVPSLLDDGGLGLRMMTIDEIAALSDHSRNQMLSARRRFARYAAREKPEQGN